MTQNTNTASGAADSDDALMARELYESQDDSLLLCASDLQHSAIYDNHAEMRSCIRAVAERITALASAPAQPASSDAYEGAREDLSIWMRRALEAERDLRAEKAAAARLVAELNAKNGPTRMGEPATPLAYGATEYGWTDHRRLEDGDKRLMALIVSLYGNDHQSYSDLEGLLGRAFRATPAQPAAQQGAAYAATPTSNYAGRVYEEGFLIGTCQLYTADQLRAFADATYALRASHGQAPATVQADSVLEDALSDAVRVPLDSLHADAAYLIGRLRDGSMPYARVIEIIRERIDAAKAAIRASAAYGQAPADAAPSAGAVAGPDDIDAIALTRYKVVHSHDSMFHRFAVVAGDGKQQLYLGRETECQNMTRKFAGAFLDGAFYQSQIAAAPTPAAQAADSVQEDSARLDWLLLRISGAEFRRLGVHYSGNARRADVDAARKQGEKR